MAQSIVSTILGYDIDENEDPDETTINPHCDDKCFDEFLCKIVKMVYDPNPASRHTTGIWLLAFVKNCSKRAPINKRKDILQYAFTELLSDDSGNDCLLLKFGTMKKEFFKYLLINLFSEFVQDVASRGLGLVYELSAASDQGDLANSLLNQLLGGKRQVNQVTEDTKLFEDGVLGKTPTG